MIRPASSLFFFSGNKTFTVSAVCALLLLLVQMYLNTGTLSAYAVTLGNPFVREGYIVNYDYVHYECNYHFIMGDHVDTWGWGWVLRRELFYILSFPLFKLCGFYIGGLLSACIITLVSFYFFIRFVYTQIGIRAAYVALALLATYPGTMYWIGSPFAQVMIGPCCCWIYMIMWKMEETERLKKHVIYLSVISILFTAYDLFVFFYPAILLLYLRRRRWMTMLISLPVMLIPQMAIVYWLKARGVTEFHTENSGLYMGILQAYLHVDDLSAWLKILAEVPGILVQNFFDSGFLCLPIAFLIMVIMAYRIGFRLNRIEGSVLLFALLIFLFNNVAPPYTLDASLRGGWIARLYQPIFIVMIMYIARLAEYMKQGSALQTRVLVGVVAVCTCFNLVVNTGGVFKSRLTQRMWYRFYQHASPGTMMENLTKFGVRPLGFPEETAGPPVHK